MNFHELINNAVSWFTWLITAIIPLGQKVFLALYDIYDTFKTKSGLNVTYIARYTGNTAITGLQLLIDLIKEGLSHLP